tara:strand:+ start:240 stop:599 length:360 start_codon:yes stop_codon:yes gene_type:complete
MVEANNEVLISPCTKESNFESMKLDFIEIIKDMANGAKVLITTDIERDDFITCSTDVCTDDSGYGNYYGRVRFVNPESIVNFIIHCAGYTDVGSIGFGVTDISKTEVEIELISANQARH